MRGLVEFCANDDPLPAASAIGFDHYRQTAAERKYFKQSFHRQDFAFAVGKPCRNMKSLAKDLLPPAGRRRWSRARQCAGHGR